jgi:hypothetical protein
MIDREVEEYPWIELMIPTSTTVYRLRQPQLCGINKR